MEGIKRYLVDWFAAKNKSLPIDTELSYFELGLIDSFGVIELIEAIETKYSIRFTELHFQDRRFGTILGLTKIINEILTAKDSNQ